ncbi:hypothetical protein GCM10027168_13980 [Streptomyces capparidis]
MAERQPPSAEDVVRSFVTALGAASAAVREALPEAERLADLPALARSGRIGRRGEVGGHRYAVHDAGCRLIDPGGLDVDVDFADGAAVFDIWRLRCHGRSLPGPVDPSPEELRHAIRGLGGLLAEVRPGWYAVTGHDPEEGRAPG